MTRNTRTLRLILAVFGLVILIGFLIPERLAIPVKDASILDWNQDAFWFEPWGPSGVHKGIDIFAPKGQSVLAATGGIVIFSGKVNLGGNVVLVLGPKWRVHYYAHLDTSSISTGAFVSSGRAIGTVGTSGNAQDKPSHLHFVILSVFPYPWNFESGTQGWKRMFYLDPNEKLRSGNGT